MRILIAEDETIVRLDLRSHLESEGLEVCAEARDGAEAIRLARKTQPDLAIMDVMMPGVDGIETARAITRHRSIPIVIVSGHSQKAIVRRAANAGVSAFLVKPLDFRHLVPTIETAVARHRDLVAATAGIAPRRRTPRPVEDRRTEITAAAVRAFYEKGYEASTIQEVADRVGMLKGSLYHHIASKDDLLFDIVREAARRGADTVTRADAGLDAAAALHASLLAYAAYVTQNIEAVTVAARDARSLPDHHRDVVDGIRVQHVGALATLVADAQAAGRISCSLPPIVLAETFVGMSDWVAQRHAPGGPGAADLTAAFVYLVTRGLAVDRAAM